MYRLWSASRWFKSGDWQEQSHSCSSTSAPLPFPLAGYHIGILNTSEPYVEADLGGGQQGAALVGVLIAAATLGSLAAGRAADRLGPR